MARKNNAAATPQNTTSRGTPIREFLNSNLSFEALRQSAAILLTGKDLVRNILGMTPEDQTKFLDKVDQVCQSLPQFLKSLDRNFYKGLPYFRLAKREIYRCPGKCMQCNSAASDLSCPLRRTQETWHHGRSIRRSYRHLARRSR